MKRLTRVAFVFLLMLPYVATVATGQTTRPSPTAAVDAADLPKPTHAKIVTQSRGVADAMGRPIGDVFSTVYLTEQSSDLLKSKRLTVPDTKWFALKQFDVDVVGFDEEQGLISRMVLSTRPISLPLREKIKEGFRSEYPGVGTEAPIIDCDGSSAVKPITITIKLDKMSRDILAGNISEELIEAKKTQTLKIGMTMEQATFVKGPGAVFEETAKYKIIVWKFGIRTTYAKFENGKISAVRIEATE